MANSKRFDYVMLFHKFQGAQERPSFIMADGMDATEAGDLRFTNDGAVILLIAAGYWKFANITELGEMDKVTRG